MRFEAGPSLILVVIVLVGLAAYERLTRNKRRASSQVALRDIRRCPECQQIIAPSATTCRHCGATTPPDPAA